MRTGNESEPAPVGLKTRSVRAWLFDIDGVLTDPVSKVVRRPSIIAELVQRLRRGEPVGSNTGRSLAFVEERLLGPLEAAAGDASLLRLVFVAAEKGAATLVYGNDGKRRRRLDADLSVEGIQGLMADVGALVAERYADAMFLDRSKRTMVTVEMADGLTVDAFRQCQFALLPDLKAIIRRRGLDGRVRLDATRIAIDIEHPKSGKALGARKFVEFLRERSVTPNQCFAFGDSVSDYEMAEELHRLGLSVTFVFVGGADTIRWELSPFPTVVTRGLCDDGTLEYLHAES